MTHSFADPHSAGAQHEATHERGDLPTLPDISVVVPVYGAADSLDELCRRIGDALLHLDRSFEIVLVDDRSPDDAWAKIRQLCERNPRVRGLRLSRNFGQHVAITAGLRAAHGQLVVVMDCDLQDPPEDIPRLLSALREGQHDYVLARRVKRSHSAVRLVSARLYFSLLSALSGERLDASFGTFSVLTRKVVDAILQFGERERHYLFLLRWLGFNAGAIDYSHAERATGQSTYSFSRLVRHAVDGIFFQATTFLRWIVVAGISMAMTGFVAAAFLAWHYFVGAPIQGWASLAVLVLLCTGMLLASMGVIGIYVGKIFDQSKARPLYVLDEELPAARAAATRRWRE